MYDDSGLAAAGCIGIGLSVVVGLVIAAFLIYCYWRICAKAGYSGALSLLNLVPGVGTLILVCVLAFGKWPIHSDSSKNQG